jgi:hypothetical protein
MHLHTPLFTFPLPCAWSLGTGGWTPVGPLPAITVTTDAAFYPQVPVPPAELSLGIAMLLLPAQVFTLFTTTLTVRGETSPGQGVTHVMPAAPLYVQPQTLSALPVQVLPFPQPPWLQKEATPGQVVVSPHIKPAATMYEPQSRHSRFCSADKRGGHPKEAPATSA